MEAVREIVTGNDTEKENRKKTEKVNEKKIEKEIEKEVTVKETIIHTEELCKSFMTGNVEQQVLKNIDMVGNDLALSAGMCGSVSGGVPVTVGQPTIRVSSILVGGRDS